MSMKGDPIWFRDLRVLFRRDRLREFFPTRDQTFEERINALVRLIVYVSVLVYLYNRDSKYPLYGLACIALITLAYTSKKAETFKTVSAYQQFRAASVEAAPAPCTGPTNDNPFGNMLLTDLADNPDRPAACLYDNDAEQVEDKFNHNLYRNLSDVYSKQNSQRQYYSMPVTTSIPDQKAFAEFCYNTVADGELTCKEDRTSAACGPQTDTQ